MTSDFITIDGQHYKILDRQPVRYPCAESEQERKARGKGPAPEVAYTSARIERVQDA